MFLLTLTPYKRY